MSINWQTIIVALLLIAAVIYIIRVVKRSVQSDHECSDCGVPVQKGKKIKSFAKK